MKQKIMGTGKYFKLLLFKIIWEDSHSKTSCLQEVVWPVVAVSFLYPDGFWPHHLVSGLMPPRTGHRLSKRPSNNSLIHFYKRCVSMALRLSIDHSIYSGSKKIHWTDEKCLREWLKLFVMSCFSPNIGENPCIYCQLPIQVLTWRCPEVNFGYLLVFWWRDCVEGCLKDQANYSLIYF